MDDYFLKHTSIYMTLTTVLNLILVGAGVWAVIKVVTWLTK